MCNFIFVWVALVRVVAGYFEIKVLIVWGHSDINTIYYKWIFLKKSKLEPAIVWKRVTCQRITSKNTRTRWVDTWARDKIRWYWSADTLSIDHNIDLQTDFSWATKPARNCESKHWSPLWVRTDGRSFWRSVYGHVIRDLKIPRYRCTGTGSVPVHVKCSCAWLFRLRYPKNKHTKLTLYMHIA